MRIIAKNDRQPVNSFPALYIGIDNYLQRNTTIILVRDRGIRTERFEAVVLKSEDQCRWPIGISFKPEMSQWQPYTGTLEMSNS